jgi:MinD superfamily P-loop ATPase
MPPGPRGDGVACPVGRGPVVVTVASGKGGTGKTTVAVSLAMVAPGPVAYADCDVEEPDGALFLHPTIEEERPFTQLLPRFDEALCDGCGICHDVCAYQAILVAGKPLLFADRCHACGACAALCPRGAIREEPAVRGTLRLGRRMDIVFFEGRLAVGEASPTALVREVRREVERDHSLVIVDAAPGTSCPVIAAAHRADFLLLVTEPTPLGLHDLALAVEMGRALELPMGVVINRSGEGDDGDVERFAAGRGIPVLARIPFDRRIAAAYARGEVLVEALPEYREHVEGLWREILTRTRR